MANNIIPKTKEHKPRIYKATGTNLTYKQTLFIGNYKKNGGNGTKALLDSGYNAKNRNTAGVMANETLKIPKIQQEINPSNIVEEATKIIKKESINSVNQLLHLRDKSRNDIVKRQATDSLLDRAGLMPIQKHQSININIDSEALTQLQKALDRYYDSQPAPATATDSVQVVEK